MICENCGERMEGDGYSLVYHCPSVDEVALFEPDANPVHCELADEEKGESA